MYNIIDLILLMPAINKHVLEAAITVKKGREDHQIVVSKCSPIKVEYTCPCGERFKTLEVLHIHQGSLRICSGWPSDKSPYSRRRVPRRYRALKKRACDPLQPRSVRFSYDNQFRFYDPSGYGKQRDPLGNLFVRSILANKCCLVAIND